MNLVRGDCREEGLTSAAGSVESHLMAFAAEKSRLEGRVIEMVAYRREVARDDGATGRQG